jgi:hypothetical protein
MSGDGWAQQVFECEVVAEGPVYGRGATVPYVLGTCRTISPKLALRWLRSQARRVANGLDPQPGPSAWEAAVSAPVWAAAPDVPAELREWCDDPAAQREARDRLRELLPVRVTVADEANGRFTLSVRPSV